MSDDFDRAIERVVHDQSPTAELANLDTDEQAMVRMAQLLRGSRAQDARPVFADELRERVVRPRRISRRTAFISGIGTLAAGVLAGVGLDRLATSSSTSNRKQALVGGNGRWQPVAQLADLPDGSIRAFEAGAVQGFLIHRSGNVRAVSRMCTHMGCRLNFEHSDQAFVCPCHGAEFDLQGNLRYGFGGYRHALPPLPEINTRIKAGAVEVWTA